MFGLEGDFDGKREITERNYPLTPSLEAVTSFCFSRLSAYSYRVDYLSNTSPALAMLTLEMVSVEERRRRSVLERNAS